MWIRRLTKFEHRGCGGHFSFYRDVIGQHWAGGADEKAAAPIHRLCTLARKMHVRSIVIEDAHDRPEIQAEINHLEAWSGTAHGDVIALAVSFLTAAKPRIGGTAVAAAEQLIGQATLVTFPTDEGPRTFVVEAIFRLPRSGRRPSFPLLNNYVPVAREFDVRVAGVNLQITGSGFHQQNGVTSVCVHGAVRSLLRNIAGITAKTEDLNALWGFKGGRHQVDTAMVCKAFGHFGLCAIQYDLTSRLETTLSAEDVAWRMLACLAESSTSVILKFEPVGPASHVVAVVGFTLNTDEWLPHAAPAYLSGRPNDESSSAWIDHLVVHDDLLGPYYCISRADLFERETKHKATLKPKTAIALLPSGVEVSPVVAEQTARAAFPRLIEGVGEFEGVLWSGGVWWDRLTHQSARRVWRTTLVSRDAYMATLRAGRIAPSLRVANASILDECESQLPARFWLVEVTLPQLYVGNRARLGEVLIKADTTPDDAEDAVAGFRFPGVIGWADGNKGEFPVAPFPMRRHSPLHAPLYHLNGW